MTTRSLLNVLYVVSKKSYLTCFECSSGVTAAFLAFWYLKQGHYSEIAFLFVRSVFLPDLWHSVLLIEATPVEHCRLCYIVYICVLFCIS